MSLTVCKHCGNYPSSMFKPCPTFQSLKYELLSPHLIATESTSRKVLCKVVLRLPKRLCLSLPRSVLRSRGVGQNQQMGRAKETLFHSSLHVHWICWKSVKAWQGLDRIIAALSSLLIFKPHFPFFFFLSPNNHIRFSSAPWELPCH